MSHLWTASRQFSLMPATVCSEIVNRFRRVTTSVVANLTLLIRGMSKMIPHDTGRHLSCIEGVSGPEVETRKIRQAHRGRRREDKVTYWV